MNNEVKLFYLYFSSPRFHVIDKTELREQNRNENTLGLWASRNLVSFEQIWNKLKMMLA